MKSLIKYNLWLSYEKMNVANLADLKDNFNFDDILDLYKSKELLFWLDSRSEDFANEYSEIKNKIIELNNNSEDDELIFDLYKIFFPNKQENEKNIKNTIKFTLEKRRSRDAKVSEYQLANEEFSKNKGYLNNKYLEYVGILVNKGRKGFKEPKEAWKIINDDWSELFKLNCSSLIHLLSNKKCYFSILELLRFCKLRKIVSDSRDEQTMKIWKEYSNLGFYKEFYKTYGNNFVEYGADIKIVNIINLDNNERLNKSVENTGKFLILNIPSCYEVKNRENEKIDIGNFCDGGVNLVSKTVIKLPAERNFEHQLHYIGAL